MKTNWAQDDTLHGAAGTLELVGVARVNGRQLAGALERLLRAAGLTVETQRVGEISTLAVPAEFSDLAKQILAKKRREVEDEEELDDEDDDLDDDEDDDLDDEDEEDDFDDDDEEFEEEFDDDELDEDDDIFYDEDEDE